MSNQKEAKEEITLGSVYDLYEDFMDENDTVISVMRLIAAGTIARYGSQANKKPCSGYEAPVSEDKSIKAACFPLSHAKKCGVVKHKHSLDQLKEHAILFVIQEKTFMSLEEDQERLVALRIGSISSKQDIAFSVIRSENNMYMVGSYCHFPPALSGWIPSGDFAEDYNHFIKEGGCFYFFGIHPDYLIPLFEVGIPMLDAPSEKEEDEAVS